MLRSTPPSFETLAKLFNALIESVETNKRFEIIDEIVNSGVDINVKEPTEFGNTIFTTLLVNETIDIFTQVFNRYLKKINFTQQDNDGKTMLSLAIRMIKPTLVALILNHDKSAINIQDKEGRTPLHYACMLGITAVANDLIINGASLIIQDKNGLIPADYLTCSEEDVYACLRTVSIDPNRHPIAPADRLKLNNTTPMFLPADFKKYNFVPGLPWYDEIHHPTPQTAGRFGILLCHQNVDDIFSFLNIDVKTYNFKRASDDLKMLYAMKKNPDTLLDSCIRNRKQFAAFVYFKTAQSFLKQGQWRQAYLYLFKVEKFYQKNAKNLFCDKKQLDAFHKKISNSLQTNTNLTFFMPVPLTDITPCNTAVNSKNEHRPTA